MQEGCWIDVRPYQEGYAQAATVLFRQSSFFLHPCSDSWSWNHQGKSQENSAKKRGIIIRDPSIQAIQLRETIQNIEQA